MAYYVRSQKAPFEEDAHHEFKGHFNLCNEDVPFVSRGNKSSGERATRKPISRNLNGFLNSMLGGTVHIGILDNGEVHGVKLTRNKKDHVVGAVRDLFKRYKPRVNDKRWGVRFIPVVSEKTTDEERKQMAAAVDASEQYREPIKHQYRTHRPCGCHRELIAMYKEHGVLITDYVIEIVIYPWDPTLYPEDIIGSIFKVGPIYYNEEDRIYFRRASSTVMCETTEIVTLARYEAAKRALEIKDKLKQEINDKKRRIALHKHKLAIRMNIVQKAAVQTSERRDEGCVGV